MRTLHLGLLLASTLWGMPATAQQAAAAEALFEDGRELLKAGQLEQACKKLEASLKLDPGIGTQLYLADCWERQGRTASAWAAFKEVTSKARAATQHERAKIADIRASALAPQLVYVRLRVARDMPSGLRITHNGIRIPAETYDVPIPVDPGPVTLCAEAPGFQAWSSTVRLTTPGQTREVRIPRLTAAPRPVSTSTPTTTAGPAQQTPRANSAPRDDSPLWSQRTSGLILGGAGVLALGAGTWLGLAAMGKNDDSKAECRPDDGSLCSARGVELRDQAERRATWSTIAFAGGAALVAGGAVLYLTAADDKSVHLQPAIGPRSAAVSLGGRF